MNEAHYHFYRGCKKPPSLKTLQPTDANPQLYMLWAHLQMLLWKAVDQRDPHEEARTITKFGWASKAPQTRRPSQQRQLLPKHF